MIQPLPLRFFRYGTNDPVSAADPAWRGPLPADRFSRSGPAAATLGNYFDAAADFLGGAGREALHFGLRAALGPDADLGGVAGVDVILEKHGAFYHPARVRVRHCDGEVALALNVAVSAHGRDLAARECQNLSRLGRRIPDPGLPTVFGFGEGRTGDISFPMFLCQWLTDFHEFHLSRRSNGDLGTVVWGDEGVNFFLSPDQARRLYREVARLLARHYDSSTFEQIFPWHHAAGDFVVRPDADDLSVRLVTVRQYAPMFSVRSGAAGHPADSPAGLPLDADPVETVAAPEGPSEAELEGLLLFLANLSLRNRLDRLDGVGDVAVADPWVIDVSLEGALAGLADGGGPATAFREYLRSRAPGELAEAFLAVAGTWRPDAPETEALQSTLADHILAFWEAVNRL
ncbi:MAG: hypothetical protein ACOC98_07755 [Thermodesulfobacteriota bacterium]